MKLKEVARGPNVARLKAMKQMKDFAKGLTKYLPAEVLMYLGNYSHKNFKGDAGILYLTYHDAADQEDTLFLAPDYIKSELKKKFPGFHLVSDEPEREPNNGNGAPTTYVWYLNADEDKQQFLKDIMSDTGQAVQIAENPIVD